MIPLKLDIRYDKDFINKDVKNLFLNLIKSNLTKNESAHLLNYIKENYNISIDQFWSTLKSNIDISFVDNKYYQLTINPNVYIIPNTKLITIVDLINYGNRSIKGNLLFDNIVRYVEENIRHIRRLKLMKGKMSIWA